MKKGIIWIASYPKSGNTLLRLFLSHYIFGNGNELDFELLKNIPKFESKKTFLNAIEDTNFSNNFNYIKYCLEVQRNLIQKLSQENLIFKTHHFFGHINGHYFTNKENTLGFIYLIRDPREIVVSYSNHTKTSVDQIIKILTQKNEITPSGWETKLNWTQQYNSWKSFNGVPSLFIKFEDLVTNQFEVFSFILKFLSNLKNINFNPLKIKQTIELIKFSNLQKKEKAEGFSEIDTGREFFRSGKFNTWKDVLTIEQINEIEKHLGDLMKKFNYI